MSVSRLRNMSGPCVVALALLLCSAIVTGCGGRTPDGPARSGAAVTVFTSIPPQAFLAESIGGDRIDVRVLLRPSDNPHTFKPTPRQVSELASADIFFTAGIPFEEQLVTKVPDRARFSVVDTSAGIERRAMTGRGAHSEEASEHDGVDENAHAGARKDPHTWMSPMLAQKHAENICDALKEQDPAGAETYEKNLEALKKKFDELDGRLRRTLQPVRGRTMYVFHPAYGYFADAYGLRQAPIQVEGKSPGAQQLSEIVERAWAENVRAIFVQPQFSAKRARAVARAVGAEVVPLDPLARDYVRNMEQIAVRVRDALADAPASEDTSAEGGS